MKGIEEALQELDGVFAEDCITMRDCHIVENMLKRLAGLDVRIEDKGRFWHAEGNVILNFGSVTEEEAGKLSSYFKSVDENVKVSHRDVEPSFFPASPHILRFSPTSAELKPIHLYEFNVSERAFVDKIIPAIKDKYLKERKEPMNIWRYQLKCSYYWNSQKSQANDFEERLRVAFK